MLRSKFHEILKDSVEGVVDEGDVVDERIRVTQRTASEAFVEDWLKIEIGIQTKGQFAVLPLPD